MANFNYTKHFLNKIEDLYSETEYNLRYERGHFKSGYCVLKSEKIAIVNKFYSLEGKINCLIEMLKEIEVNTNNLNQKNKKLFIELSQITELS
jgi:predicted nuclease with TOPRIM domain